MKINLYLREEREYSNDGNLFKKWGWYYAFGKEATMLSDAIGLTRTVIHCSQKKDGSGNFIHSSFPAVSKKRYFAKLRSLGFELQVHGKFRIVL